MAEPQGMSTTLLIPTVGAVCVAVAAMLLPSGSRRPAGCRCTESPSESEERLVTLDEIDTLCAAFDQMLSRRDGGQFPA
jgi:hypothetical protein